MVDPNVVQLAYKGVQMLPRYLRSRLESNLDPRETMELD